MSILQLHITFHYASASLISVILITGYDAILISAAKLH